MKCIKLYDYGGAEQLRIEQGEVPHPGPQQVLVRVAGAAINPVDTKLRSGILRDYLPLALPFVLGADFAGTITAEGEGVDPARIGERVMGMVDVLEGGAYAEYMVVPADRAVPVPDGLDLETAAALPMGVMTGYDLIEIGLDIQPGERVAVTGAAGSVGRAAVFCAAERGAKVIALVRTLPETPIAGAAQVIAIGDGAAMAQIGALDCVADTIGGDLADKLCTNLRAGGRFSTVVGAMQPAHDQATFSVSKVVVAPRADPLLHFSSAMVAGRALLPAIRRLPLEQATQAHQLMEAGGAGQKLVLVPDLNRKFME